MKKIHYLLLALVCGIFASCADGNSNFFNNRACDDDGDGEGGAVHHDVLTAGGADAA